MTATLRHRPQVLLDVVLLLARVGLGVVLVAHGWQKLDTQGLSATADGFAGLGIPAAEAAAYGAVAVELVGGALLILGVLTPVLGLLVVAVMAGAFWYVHRANGVFVADGGWELVLALGLLGLTLAATGAGRLSVDHLLVGRRRSRREAKTDRDLTGSSASGATSATAAPAGTAGQAGQTPVNG